MAGAQRQAGFTLTELIIVIVLLGIVAVIPVSFVRDAARGAVDTANRQQLSLSASVASEQLTRALRAALPGSLRVSPNQRCIEFIPILASTVYQAAPMASPATEFQVLALSGTRSAQGRAVIYPYAGSQADLYAPASPGVISAQTVDLPAGTDDVTLTFDSGSHQFVSDSPGRRLFVVDTPVSFCQKGTFLYRYQNYGFQAAIDDNLPATFAAGREVIAAPLEANTMTFDAIPPTLRRNAIVTFEFALQSDRSDDRMTVSQEVQLRNVP